jgi:hypothetical protein
VTGLLARLKDPRAKDGLTALLFLSPFVLTFAVFLAYPLF